jgi:ABC-type transport system involved in cytochrome c biogenesis permease subunit
VSYEYYSSLCLVTAVVVYALAMFAHAAEWAAARRTEEAETADEHALVSVGAATSAEPVNGHPARVDGHLPPAGTAGRQRVEQFGRIGVALTVIGFLLSVSGVVLRGLAAGRPPWGNMFEFTITAMVLVVGVYLVMVWRSGVRWLGLPVTLLAAVGNGLAITVFYVAVAPLVPALHSVWFVIHIVAAATSGRRSTWVL